MLSTLLNLWISAPALTVLEEERPGDCMADEFHFIRCIPIFCLAMRKYLRILVLNIKNVCSGYLLLLPRSGHMA